jgi:hypothetical protein
MGAEEGKEGKGKRTRENKRIHQPALEKYHRSTRTIIQVTNITRNTISDGITLAVW